MNNRLLNWTSTPFLTAGSPGAAQNRLAYLDGLRGWAALSVLVFHVSWEYFGKAIPELRSSSVGLINDGHFAVSVFFVLSGFVLCKPFVTSPDQERLRRMAAGRYLRLFIPVAIVSFIGYLLSTFSLLANAEAGLIVRSPWMSGLMQQLPSDPWSFLRFISIDAFTGLAGRPAYNPFIWTMEYELLGSFMLFGTLSLIGNQTLLRQAILAITLILFALNQSFYAMFFAGAIIAEVDTEQLARINTRLRNGIGISLLAVVWLSSWKLRGHFQLPLAAVTLCGVLTSPLAQWGLTTKLSSFLGRISFPLYLVHGYILFGPASFAVIALHRSGYQMETVALWVIFGSVAASILIAAILSPIEALAKTVASRSGMLMARPETSREAVSVPAFVHAALHSLLSQEVSMFARATKVPVSSRHIADLPEMKCQRAVRELIKPGSSSSAPAPASGRATSYARTS